jgi:para-aminobenzoate synthetase component 1
MRRGWALTERYQIIPVPWPCDIVAAAHSFRDRADFAWLEGSTAGGGHCVLAADPIAVLEQRPAQDAVFRARDQVVDSDRSFWRLWRRIHRRLPQLAPSEAPAPGWVGYVGYEAARQLERLPATTRDDLGLPLARLALFDQAVVLDHSRAAAWVVGTPLVAQALSVAPSSLENIVDRWTVAARATLIPAPCAAAQVERTSRSLHEARVQRALEYIAAGDIYQVNLAHRLTLRGLDDPLAVFAALRRINPAPYAALLRWRGGAVVSVSPELFLKLVGRAVLTSPIKGTRPRTGDGVLDAIRRQALLDSEKDAAELAMIVDLHRNDLGRVCEYGSVRVAGPRRVEAHPTVYHTLADVTGTLRLDCDGIDLLAACFPAGSVTGAPKIRAMEIIDELEPACRGAYTGAIGRLGLDGGMSFNVAIRTLQVRETKATLHIGGGIVADSDPAEEYEETLAKGRGILAALGTGGMAPRAAGNHAVGWHGFTRSG